MEQWRVWKVVDAGTERAADAKIGDIEEIDLKEIVGQIPWSLLLIRHDQERY